ncbi:MAG: endopeptidase La [Deltaproteobacteria bacterium]|nr:endopeptidase La [Deltaproteobacteria bacterium]
MAQDKDSLPNQLLPLLPLRDIIVFPHMVVPLFVGREKSIAAIDAAMSNGRELFLSAQKKARTGEPLPEDVFEVGTVGTIHRYHKLPDGTVKVLVEGLRRGRIRRFEDSPSVLSVEVEPIEELPTDSLEIEALMRSVQSTFEVYVKLNKRVAPEMLMTVQTIEQAGALADTVIVHLASIKMADRQALLELADPMARLERLHTMMQGEIDILQVEKKIRTRVKRQMERTQKEYYLNEQMQAIQKELGERDEFKSEMHELEERLRSVKGMSDEATDRVKKELRKLKMMQPMSAEASVVRNYIDWILALPWGEKTIDRRDIDEATKILDEDHYGLKKVKERILEYLAVQSLSNRMRGPVLCLVGPPGVGKTSLARSIARCTNRNFVRISLGGVRDEAEIRGHRRTYIGALPGRLVQSLKKAASNNPVFLLDEIDKMSADFRGDPASALLEVLDPEQNNAFSDHFLDLDYDLSDVMFVTTANTLSSIPLPLQDRMEIIELSGYTEFEKLNIAVKYLAPRQLHEAGLDGIDVTITESALRAVINHYTREAGVRSLERELGSVCRKVAREVLSKGKDQRYLVEAKDIPRYLGPPYFDVGRRENHDEVGLTMGLAVTSVGGDLLPSEVAVLTGKGNLQVTGKLGDVMKESVQAAMSYVRSRARVLGLEDNFYEKLDVHVHFPEGAVPKDGPSAGITVVTALVSALTKVAVRKDVAMTGEITLRGRVLAIGGLKEKLLAAHRGGIHTVIIPKENRKDLREVPRRVLQALRIVMVDHVDDVLREALAGTFAASNEWLSQRPRPAEYREGTLIESTPATALSDAHPAAAPAV